MSSGMLRRDISCRFIIIIIIIRCRNWIYCRGRLTVVFVILIGCTADFSHIHICIFCDQLSLQRQIAISHYGMWISDRIQNGMGTQPINTVRASHSLGGVLPNVSDQCSVNTFCSCQQCSLNSSYRPLFLVNRSFCPFIPKKWVNLSHMF